MYYWKNMLKYVAQFEKNCHQCQLDKPKNRNVEELQITKAPQVPFDRVVIDTIGPFTTLFDGNKYAQLSQ